MIIALTGGIGSGKSSVAALLGSTMAYPVLSTDLICRDLLEPGEAGWLAVRERWQERFLNPDATVNRPLLKEAVFADEGLRHALEEILHPLVRIAVKIRKEAAEKAQGGLIVEVPLLFEAGWQEDFDCTVAVYAPESVCLERVCRRDGLSAVMARKILAAQMPPRAKAEKATFVIDNSGLWVQAVQQVARLAHRLRQLGHVCGNRESFKS